MELDGIWCQIVQAVVIGIVDYVIGTMQALLGWIFPPQVTSS